MRLTSRLLIIVACAFGSATASAEPLPSQIKQGRAIAVRKCSACHAVGLTDASTNPQAPALRNLFKRYPVEGLREAFLKGYRVAHPPMPKFVLSRSKVEPLLAFLESLNPCSAPSSDKAAMQRCFEPL